MKTFTSLLLAMAAIAILILKPLGEYYSLGIALILGAISGNIFKNQSGSSLSDLAHPIKTIKETFTPIEECRAESRKTLVGFALMASGLALVAAFRSTEFWMLFTIIGFLMAAVGAAFSAAYISCVKRRNEKYLGK